MHRKLLALINPAMYHFCGLSNSRYSAIDLCQKCDFFLKKRTKEMFAYVLEFMLTLATMQDNSTLM